MSCIDDNSLDKGLVRVFRSHSAVEPACARSAQAVTSRQRQCDGASGGFLRDAASVDGVQLPVCKAGRLRGDLDVVPRLGLLGLTYSS